MSFPGSMTVWCFSLVSGGKSTQAFSLPFFLCVSVTSWLTPLIPWPPSEAFSPFQLNLPERQRSWELCIPQQTGSWKGILFVAPLGNAVAWTRLLLHPHQPPGTGPPWPLSPKNTAIGVQAPEAAAPRDTSRDPGLSYSPAYSYLLIFPITTAVAK